jgi:hypothetical protein
VHTPLHLELGARQITALCVLLFTENNTCDVLIGVNVAQHTHARSLVASQERVIRSLRDRSLSPQYVSSLWLIARYEVANRKVLEAVMIAWRYE